MSIKAYQTAQDKVSDPRRIEIMVFQKCNALLTSAEADRSRSGDGSQSLATAKSEAHALYENDRLWTTLLADLANDDNQLAPALRARLISLGLWASRYADKVRAEKTASFEPLIHLNAQMIAGLTASLDPARQGVPSQAAGTPAPLGPIVT